MLQSILLIMGIFYAFRKPKIKSLTSAQFPRVPPSVFAEWQKLELESINLFLWATWGVLLFSGVVMLVVAGLLNGNFPGGDAGFTTYGILCFVLFFALVILSAIQGSKAAKLKKEYSISGPVTPSNTATSSSPAIPGQSASMPTTNNQTSATASSVHPAPQIEKLLENMIQKGVERVLLRPDQPMLLSKDGKEFNGPTLNKERLLSVIREVTPPQWQAQLSGGSGIAPIEFTYSSPHGNFCIEVEHPSGAPCAPQVAITRAAKPIAMEKDNKGTRHETLEQATPFWMARFGIQKPDPFVMYVFDEEHQARAALLELDCIQVAADTGKLICNEVLTFGHYRREDGKYEALVCGGDLSHDLWKAAHASFARHGGVIKGDQEPVVTGSRPLSTTAGDASKVKFVREDRDVKLGHTVIYRIHQGPDAASAKAFLEQNPVNKGLYYLVVETPEGNYCRDVDGMYKE